MGETAMELGNKELKKIGDYVKSHLKEWIGEVQHAQELNLVERVIRLDERFDSMHTVLEERFQRVDDQFKRVDEQFKRVDQRFEALQLHMDRRFEATQKQMDVRFNAMDKRFRSMQWFMGTGFTLLAALLGLFHFI